MIPVSRQGWGDAPRDWLAVHWPDIAAWACIGLAALLLLAVGVWIGGRRKVAEYDRWLTQVTDVHADLPRQREPSS